MRHLPMILTALLMVVSAVVALVQGEMEDLLVPLLVLPAVLPPVLTEKWAHVHIPGSIQAQYAILLLAGPYVGEHLELYHLWDPWDKWVHFYSGSSYPSQSCLPWVWSCVGTA